MTRKKKNTRKGRGKGEIHENGVERKKTQEGNEPKRKDISDLIGHLLTFFGSFSVFLTLLFGIIQYKSTNDRQKKADTIAYMQTLHELINNTDDSLLEIIKLYDSDSINNSISCDSLAAILHRNPNYRKQLDNIMIGFNRLAIGCQEGFFDEETIWSADCRMVVNVTKALLPYFELVEKETGRINGNHVCCFWRIMAFKWEHDRTMGDKYNNMIKHYAQEIEKTINDSIEIGRRFSVLE